MCSSHPPPRPRSARTTRTFRSIRWSNLSGRSLRRRCVMSASGCIARRPSTRARGIIIADTKFEFGTDPVGNLVLIDEALTADSSRFWPADEYRPGISPPSFDKQYVRDYLETLGWKKTPPAPRLPPEVVARTSEKYREALFRLTGKKLGG